MMLGNVLYRIDVTGDVSSDGHISLWADDVATGLDGSLICTCHTPDNAAHFNGLIIPPGCWKRAYAIWPDGRPLVTLVWERGA